MSDCRKWQRRTGDRRLELKVEDVILCEWRKRGAKGGAGIERHEFRSIRENKTVEKEYWSVVVNGSALSPQTALWHKSDISC